MIKIIHNGKEIAKGHLIEGRTYVRIADILTGLDYSFLWQDDTVTITPKIGTGINDIQLTTNFNLQEFACKHCGVVKLDAELVKKLQELRDRIGKPITITSGYRCETHNRNVGGVAGSQHVLGKAADIVVDGITPKEVARQAEAVGFNGIGIYESFTHVDTRANKARW